MDADSAFWLENHKIYTINNFIVNMLKYLSFVILRNIFIIIYIEDIGDLKSNGVGVSQNLRATLPFGYERGLAAAARCRGLATTLVRSSPNTSRRHSIP